MAPRAHFFCHFLCRVPGTTIVLRKNVCILPVDYIPKSMNKQKIYNFISSVVHIDKNMFTYHRCKDTLRFCDVDS